MTERKFEPINEVTMYQARCTNCGTIEDDYGDFSAWGDKDIPVTDVVENQCWLQLDDTDELLCPACQSCAVCGTGGGYAHDDGKHVVCGDHEDYDFDKLRAVPS